MYVSKKSSNFVAKIGIRMNSNKNCLGKIVVLSVFLLIAAEIGVEIGYVYSVIQKYKVEHIYGDVEIHHYYHVPSHKNCVFSTPVYWYHEGRWSQEWVDAGETLGLDARMSVYGERALRRSRYEDGVLVRDTTPTEIKYWLKIEAKQEILNVDLFQARNTYPIRPDSTLSHLFQHEQRKYALDKLYCLTEMPNMYFYTTNSGTLSFHPTSKSSIVQIDYSDKRVRMSVYYPCTAEEILRLTEEDVVRAAIDLDLPCTEPAIKSAIGPKQRIRLKKAFQLVHDKLNY